MAGSPNSLGKTDARAFRLATCQGLNRSGVCAFRQSAVNRNGYLYWLGSHSPADLRVKRHDPQKGSDAIGLRPVG